MGCASPFYTSTFQELSNGILKKKSNDFGPFDYSLKIWKSIGTPTPKMGAHLRMNGFILSHLPTLQKHEM